MVSNVTIDEVQIVGRQLGYVVNIDVATRGRSFWTWSVPTRLPHTQAHFYTKTHTPHHTHTLYDLSRVVVSLAVSHEE